MIDSSEQFYSDVKNISNRPSIPHSYIHLNIKMLIDVIMNHFGNATEISDRSGETVEPC